ncbi:MAG: hypothetical protein ACFE68_07655 [Candidatus Hodarchaeota archaeon]
MGKKENHKQDLVGFFDGFLKDGEECKLVEYLVSNSNLPGRRANLELGQAFVEVVEDYFGKDPERLWSLCLKLIEVSSDEAPVNYPREFLPFCGVWAIGGVGSVSSDFFQKALARLKELANDPRWRLREAVAFGIQKLIGREGEKTLRELEGWIVEGNWLEMRAVAAGVAEPGLLSNKKVALQGLVLHKKIFDQIIATEERKSETFKKLKQALGYSLSVVVCAVPKEGFEYMYQLLDSKDPDVLWIVKENLKKNRLKKSFPDYVASIKESLK